MVKATIEVAEHYGVGLVGIGQGHGEVIVISDTYDPSYTPGDDITTLFACPKCGLVAEDKSRFSVTVCDPENNPIPKTLRESIESGDYPD